MSHSQMPQSEKSMWEVGETGKKFLKTSRDLKKGLKVFEKGDGPPNVIFLSEKTFFEIPGVFLSGF